MSTGRRAAAGYLAGALALVVAPAAARAQNCDSIMPRPGAVTPVQRPFYPEDLARLRDIGVHDLAFPGARSISLSPDGTRVAFQLRQAIPDTNSYCLAMVILDLAPGASPRIVDRGGELIRMMTDFRGKAGMPSGNPLPISPQWSADGRWIAYLKRDGATVQVWRAWADGQGGEPLTQSSSDIHQFVLAGDGRSIIFATRPGLDVARREIDHEGLSGFHYDDRYAPLAGSRPFPAMPIERRTLVQALGRPAARAATAAEVAVLDGAQGPVLESRSPSGRRAWIAAARAPGGAMELLAEDATGKPRRCDGCRASSFWWSGDGTRVRFLQREGWARSSNALYEWLPSDAAPRRLFVTDDVLADCVARGDELLCLREGALQPRRIAWVNRRTGKTGIVFDPNPETSGLAFGKVERLTWRNDRGIECFGDLVLPLGYQPDKRYPLIIVQYESRGFLRGGTGDEYPIQAFAGRGYAVLSFNRPRDVADLSGATDGISVNRANLDNFADRRSVQSALEVIVRQLIDRGVVDRDRIGITGLSDGTSTVQFGLVNSRLFAAAAVSSATWEPSFAMLVGPNAAKMFKAVGYPGMTRHDPDFWNRISLARNARLINVPLLMQVPDDSYLGALESYTALWEVSAPADLFVFPNEHHIKWQPAHRLAIYRRSLDWFDYWLRGLRSDAPDRQADLARWDLLARDRATRAVGAQSAGLAPAQ